MNNDDFDINKIIDGYDQDDFFGYDFELGEQYEI